jgi:EmrB/QacA subfamily drug resistance transporter
MSSMAAAPLDPRRWKALAVVGVAFLMTGVDVTIVNVALPTIGRELHLSTANLQWVVSAYAIAFGGFLLLGGRAADLLGRRAVFAAGVVLFTAASLGCGLSRSDTALIVLRGVQGIGAAVVAPAALSIVGTAFPEGAERNKALGVWGALGGSGAAIGVIFGGILTKYAGWDWIFFVNVPIGLAVLALTPVFVSESRVKVERRRYDPLGAISISGSIALLVYTIVKAPDVGWGAARTIVMLVASAALLAAFIVIEHRGKDPLMPLSIWRLHTVTTANVLGVVFGAIMFSTFFMLTLYTQQVLGYSPLQTGMAMLATALTAIASAVAAEATVTRLGPKYVLTTGVAFMFAGLAWFSQIPVHGSYLTNLFGPLVLIGLGTGFSFVPISIIALAGVPERESGLASGLMNTTQQVGGALGVAVVASIFAEHLKHDVAHGATPAQALVNGFSAGYWLLAAIAAVGCVATLLLLRRVDLAEHAAQPVDAHVGSSFCMNRAATSTLAKVALGDDAPEGTPSLTT